MKLSWKLYFFAALAYELWGRVTSVYAGGPLFHPTDVIYAGMFLALFGLAFRKKILTPVFWRYGFVVSLVLYLWSWIVTPLLLWHRAGLATGDILRIQAYALPLLPLLLAVYLYAWGADSPWPGGDAEEPAPPRRPTARLVFCLVALAWLVLLPVFNSNAAPDFRRGS